MDEWAKAKEAYKQKAIEKAKADGTLGADGQPPTNSDEAQRNATRNRLLSQINADDRKLDQAKEDYAAGQKGTASAQDIDKKFADKADFKPNKLMDYSGFSYYLRLTMVEPSLANKFDPTQGVVIAETGVTTEFSISELSMKHIVGWSDKSQGAFGHSGDMTIVEPLGVKFLDKIVKTASFLRIPNHTQARYFLEVTFKGTDPKTGESKFIPGLYYIWSLAFTKVSMNITEKGGEYKVKFIMTQEAASESIVENLKTVVNVPSKTVGEYFDGLAKALNAREEKNKGLTKFVPNKYTFKVDDDIKNMTFANFDPGTISQGKKSQTQDGKTLPTFREGTGILGLINIILAGTSEFQKFRKENNKSTTTANKDIKDKKKGTDASMAADLYSFYRVQTWCDFTDYDFFTRDWGRELTYFIFPSITPQIITPSDQDEYAGQDAQTVTRKRIENLKKKRDTEKQKNIQLLAKRYDYFYTGLNNSVLDFKIELNNSFLAAIPPTDDMPDNAQYGDKIKPDSKGKKPLSELNATEARQRWSSNAQELKKLEGKEGDESKRKQIEDEQKQLGEVFTQEQAQKKQKLGSLNVTGITPQEADPNKMRINPNQKYTDSQEVLSDKKIDPGFLQVRFHEDDSGNEVQQGQEGPYSKSRGSFGYIFNQLKQSADLVNINIQIIGDPYWFGVPNSLIRDRVVQAQAGNNSLMKDAANFEMGANYFYISVQTPAPYDPKTGMTTFDRNDMISGYYGVKEVTSKFDHQGQFTQTLNGFRDVGIVTPFIEKSDAQYASELRKEDKRREDEKKKKK